ncbi:NF-kappa-B inhibitor-like protein 1 isoform X4 [Anguilla anguilla]|uniref:NF-kappa-B inhibitor-like protein 1 isoform X1 n=1 Tax=Anguilla anguilla TaxID=7936 RepID=UPI0015AE23E9|nr:NF-kappa-B inhibitor-like protein 1 isoform X1 [Anguilla anguilla]XP_035246482.1 NF-kappa-B inhibitor-like protein 1 isoform X2 [Anguilla anguilla]XP_035246483.1 NF-kappa-B inhibitor-like protein 1 isoform X3 [Anguilla anguilla]XP_035246485.1 NF-kappa-B inhibitor-like protein 1 isoform X4 [Anguilla anguilla]
MVSRHQKRVLRYVEEGSLLKLKSYLRKHPDVELNFSSGKKRRGPLHVACSLGDDGVLRLLLKNGADPLLGDRNGETPLHLAAKRALKRGKRAYDDLVVPLQKSCPVAMETPNKAGVTPKDLLQWMREDQFREPPVNGGSSTATDADRAWRDKLFGECQDEFYETFGQYDEDFLHDDVDSEDFGDWAERIRREYATRQRSRAQREAAAAAVGSKGRKRRKTKEEAEEEERDRRELQERLQREHEEYLARAARKEAETRLSRRRQYEERCAATFSGGGGSAARLGYADIPWPAPRGTVGEMVEVMLHGADRTDLPTFRKLLKRQQALWHPDKFAQRCGDRLEDGDRTRILDTVTALSQELNRLAQSVR